MDLDAIRGEIVYTKSAWESDPEIAKQEVLAFLYERVADAYRVPVGAVEGDYRHHKVGDEHYVTVRMWVSTTPLLMNFTEHEEDE